MPIMLWYKAIQQLKACVTIMTVTPPPSCQREPSPEYWLSCGSEGTSCFYLFYTVPMPPFGAKYCYSSLYNVPSHVPVGFTIGLLCTVSACLYSFLPYDFLVVCSTDCLPVFIRTGLFSWLCFCLLYWICFLANYSHFIKPHIMDSNLSACRLSLQHVIHCVTSPSRLKVFRLCLLNWLLTKTWSLQVDTKARSESSPNKNLLW